MGAVRECNRIAMRARSRLSFRACDRARAAGVRLQPACCSGRAKRSEEHTSELQSLMRNSYAVFCLKKKKNEHPTRKPANNTRNKTIPSVAHRQRIHIDNTHSHDDRE